MLSDRPTLSNVYGRSIMVAVIAATRMLQGGSRNSSAVGKLYCQSGSSQQEDNSVVWIENVIQAMMSNIISWLHMYTCRVCADDMRVTKTTSGTGRQTSVLMSTHAVQTKRPRNIDSEKWLTLSSLFVRYAHLTVMISLSRERGLLWLRHEPLQSLTLRFGTNFFFLRNPLY